MLRPGAVAPGARAQMTTTGSGRLALAVTGPRGSGKSAVIESLATDYQERGIEVVRLPGAAPPTDATEAYAVLVDDAHQLKADDVAGLMEVLTRTPADVVVAYRPWPHAPELRDLVEALGQHDDPLVLGMLTQHEVAECARSLFPMPVPEPVVATVLDLTGGMPWMVESALAALAAEQDLPDEEGITEMITGAVSHDLGSIDERLREYLLHLAVGFDHSGQATPPMCTDKSAVDELVAQGVAAGLILPDGTVAPVLAEVLLTSTPVHHVRALQRELVQARVQSGGSLADVARGLARSGFQDQRVARVLVEAADRALASQPALAAELFDEALRAGGDDVSSAARRAQAAALTGELDRADQILEGLLAVGEAPDLGRAVDVSAAVWAQRGVLSRSADIYRWFGPDRVGASASLAAVVLYGVGDSAGAAAMLGVGAPVPPTLFGGSVSLMGRGVRDSVERGSAAALASLVRASDMMTRAGTIEPLPDQPAALAALVALSDGDLDLADRVLDDALKGEQGGAVARPRLLLLRAWAAMMRDRPDLARRSMSEAQSASGAKAARDELLHCALEVGLARRADDGRGLVTAWRRAREELMHVPVDLFTLLPLGELVVTAARLRDSERVEPHLSEAMALLERLGHPPLWSVPLHWAGVQAAILAERPVDLRPHAVALVRAAERSQRAAVLAHAGRTWLAVLSGQVDAPAVETAARALADVGLPWDGARLAGHAAGRADDRRGMALLLACARDLHGQGADGADRHGPAGADGAETRLGEAERADAPVADATTGAGGSPTPPAGHLSPREREVARLVVEGRTYREIGEAIYVSPRTVEHHVARMRRRLGVDTRSALLDRLRVELAVDRRSL